jgi:hypothetical protein
MKIVYIAHPVGDDVKGNLEKIRQIVRNINLTEPEVLPFAPYYLDCLALDDNNPEERARGIKNGTELLKRGFIDELRLYGDRISAGMRAEIQLASVLNIPVVAATTELRILLNNIL